jgi:hypothetical protein
MILLHIYLSCNCFVKHGKSSLQYLIWIFICRMIGLWIYCINFQMTYEEFLVHCYLTYVIRFVFWRLRQSYPNATMEDAPVRTPPPILRCEHGEEAHVKQSRHPSMAARAYYCCLYTVVSIYFFSLIEVFIFLPPNCFNVIQISINFAKVGPLQVLPVDWQDGDVWPTNSSVSLWWS